MPSGGTDNPALVLASSSPRRRELLASLDVPFVIDPPEVDETWPEALPDRAAVRRYVAELAAEKARTTARRWPPETWVLAADTIVVLGCEVLNKPADEAEAVAMLQRLAGRTHTVMTAVALHRGGAEPGPAEVVETDVTFRAADLAELRAYVARGESLDKAGAYAAQGRGALIIEGIRGCYFNVVGLPLAVTASLLRQVGFDLDRATVGDCEATR